MVRPLQQETLEYWQRLLGPGTELALSNIDKCVHHIVKTSKFDFRTPRFFNVNSVRLSHVNLYGENMIVVNGYYALEFIDSAVLLYRLMSNSSNGKLRGRKSMKIIAGSSTNAVMYFESNKNSSTTFSGLCNSQNFKYQPSLASMVLHQVLLQ